MTAGETEGWMIVKGALGDVGKSEQPMGSNCGAIVDKVCHGTEWQPPLPWCALFATYWAHRVCQAFPRFASSGEIVKWGRAHGRIVSDPRAGDLGMVIDATMESGYRHTTLVKGVVGRGLLRLVRTIEGNEGDRVCLRWRHISAMTYVRPTDN